MKKTLIVWKGFVPTEGTKDMVLSTIKPIEHLLPADSVIRISLEKTNKNYQGYGVISSPLGHFVARTSNNDLLGLCKSLKKNLKHQIFKHRDIQNSWLQAA